MFNNSKVERAQKRGLSREDYEAEAGPSKFTRRSVDIVPDIKVICVFCEKDVIGSDRNDMTKNLYERLSDCAKVLQDEKLIAKLSAGDLVAQEAKYHLNCLNAVYNRERAFFRQQREKEQNEQERHAYSRAFAELISYITESQRTREGENFFKLADLNDLMTKTLNQLGSTTSKLHTTRFKEELLDRLPGLQAHKKGRDVLLIFKDDFGPALLKASEITGALHVSKAAEIVRSDFLEFPKKMKFDGSLEEDCMETSVPQSLIELVSMIEHSPDIEAQVETETTKSDLAISHLIQYNCHQSPKKRPSMLQKHSKGRETPFVIYVGLLLFAKTRKRQLIDTLHQYGICISYDRVLEISSQMGEALVERYLEEGLVCPSVLRKGLFTTAAIIILLQQQQSHLFMAQVFHFFNTQLAITLASHVKCFI